MKKLYILLFLISTPPHKTHSMFYSVFVMLQQTSLFKETSPADSALEQRSKSDSNLFEKEKRKDEE